MSKVKKIAEKLNAGHNATDNTFRSKAKSSEKERQSHRRKNKKHQP